MNKEFITLKLNEIIPYDNNPRFNDEAVRDVIESIKQTDNLDPIEIDENNVILSGHTRLKALLKMGYTETQCIRYSGLTDEQKRKYRLLANKTGEKAEWDFEKLEQELEDLDFGDYDFGFDFGEDISKNEQKEVTDDDFSPDEEVESRCKRGQVWQLGAHRLMCGDSTNADDVDKLMNGEKADIAFMSPPYNAGFGANITKENGRSKYLDSDDNMSSDDYRNFLQSVLNVVIMYCSYVFENIQYLANNKNALITFLAENVSVLADIIIWDKERSQPAAAENVLNSEFEFVFCFSKKGNRSIGTIPFHGTLKNIVHISNQRSTEFASIHNATMPIQVAGYFVENFAKDSVIDLFGGTGTTLIACEQLDKKCFMMELSEKYCDVIIKRWEDFTGQEAVLLEE